MITPAVEADLALDNDAFAVAHVQHAFRASAFLVGKIAIANGFSGALFEARGRLGTGIVGADRDGEHSHDSA